MRTNLHGTKRWVWACGGCSLLSGMELRAGSRLKSAVCETQVIVVRAPEAAIELWCGGHAMVAMDATAPAGRLEDDHAGGTLLGKRYTDEADSFELLCTKPGKGSLSLAGQPLINKAAKPLPSSD
jgi:hypothetical protein